MKHGKLLGLIVILLFIGSFTAAAYIDPTIIDSFSRLGPNQVLSAQSISYSNTGYQSGSNWVNAYWVVTLVTDMEDQVSYYKFDSAEAAKSGSSGTVTPTSTITVKITPGQPYYQRSLVQNAKNIYPATPSYYQNKITGAASWSGGIGKLDVSYLEWGTSYWELHTPFHIEVLKNGASIITKDVDTLGTTQSIELTNPSDANEKLVIKDLGKIAAGYNSPPDLGDLIFFSADTIFKKNQNLMNEISYNIADDSFSNYWFGGGYSYKSVMGDGYVQKVPSGQSYAGANGHYCRADWVNVPVQSNEFPGNFRADDSLNYIVHALDASIWSDKSGGQYNPTGLSLINYLKNKCHQEQISTSKLNAFNNGYDITGDLKLKVYLPYYAASSLVTMKISSELADTVVVESPMANFDITGISWVGGSGTIGDSLQLKVDITQLSDRASSGIVVLSYTNGDPIQTTPASAGTGTMAKGETKSLYFQVLNTGANSITHGTITATAKDQDGKITDSASIDYTLTPRGVGSTSVTVFLLDKSDNEPVSGVTVVCKYGENSPTQITSGGSCTFDLSGYNGPVTITSVATLDYKAATTSSDVHNGVNSVTLYVEPQGYVPPPGGTDWLMYAIIAVIIAVFVGVVAIGVNALKKGGKRRRRR